MASASMRTASMNIEKHASGENPHTSAAPITKKRKAQEPLIEEGSKENVNPSDCPPSGSHKAIRYTTPPPTEPNGSVEEQPYEKTPGRDGPIKPEDFSLSPKIAPFKGPPGKKVRKSFWEKEEEYKQFCRDNEAHPFHELHVCFDKGPNGSPTYDKSGFQLDYQKVANRMKPKAYSKSRAVNGMEKAIKKMGDERRQMADIFYERGAAPADLSFCPGVDMWKDRVSKDLNIPWHKIGVPEFKIWESKGFKKAKKGEYLTIPDNQKARMTRLLSGASLRL